MKKHNKIFSCLLIFAMFLASTFYSVSAMKKAIFLFDEELEALELSESESSGAEADDEPVTSAAAAAPRVTAPIAIRPVTKVSLKKDDHLEALPGIREFLPETLIKTDEVLGTAPVRATGAPQATLPAADGMPKESSPRSRAAGLALPLQTEETMRVKECEFLAQYREILARKGSRIDTIHKWKHDIFLYLKLLYAQLRQRPETISDRQILTFFLDIKQAVDPGPRPNLDHTDCKLRFDPVYGLSGAIICIPPDDPHHILARL